MTPLPAAQHLTVHALPSPWNGKSPREILLADFPSLKGRLPVRGGWGYAMNDACIIAKAHEDVDPALPFDGVGLESVFVEKRIYEELIISRPSDDKFSGIRWNLQEQHLIESGDRHFDRLRSSVTALRDADYDSLKRVFEGPQGYGSPDFDLTAHEARHRALLHGYDSEYWFNITSFYRT